MKIHFNKNILIAMACLAASLVAASTKAQSFEINGQTINSNDKWIYLYYADQQGKQQSDSALIKANKYQFKGSVNGPTMAYLIFKGDRPGMTRENTFMFFIEPGQLQIQQTKEGLNNNHVEGSQTQAEYEQLQQQQNKIADRWQIVMDTLDAVNKRSNTEFQKLKNWVLTPYEAAQKQLQMEFFRAHPTSAATAYMLRFFVSSMPIDTLQYYYDALGPKMQATRDGQEIAKEIASIKKGSPGSMAADFVAKQLNGQNLQLSDFKGKYVLLDFWASWCVPCRASNPHLKELYAEYHNKGLEIIGVSDDDGAPDKWKAAVKKDGVGIWHNVLRGYDRNLSPGKDNPKDISSKFGIHVLPTKILIDPTGKIIYRMTGSAGEISLDEVLEKYLK